MRSEYSPEIMEARCEKLLKWMSFNINKIDDSLKDADWLLNSVKIEEEADSTSLIMARMVKIKHHLFEYLKKQREEYIQMRHNAPIARQRAEEWMLLVRPGDMLRIKPCWNALESDGGDHINMPTKILNVCLSDKGKSGVMYRVQKKNGNVIELDANFFFPGPSSVISFPELREGRGLKPLADRPKTIRNKTLRLVKK